MKYELNTYHRNTPDQELLDDLKRVADKLGKDKMTIEEYNQNGGKYSSQTMADRFRSWNKAIEKAGLKMTNQQNISEIELFKNLEDVWIKLGRQPKRRDMLKQNSKYSETPYKSKFGTWRKALEAFVEFINSDNDQNIDSENIEIEENLIKTAQDKEFIIKHKTKRIPSERLKVQVLMRDGNTCRLCGIKVTGDNIHFDHIKPWSKGGETVLENLQVLCAEHNLAKGNVEYDER